MKLERVIAVRTTKTVFRDGDKAIKVFNEDYSKADVLNEALNQARVEDTGLNIPRIVEVAKIDGKWAIVSEYIAGKTLEEIMVKNPDKIDEFLDMFVDLQMSIHKKTSPMLTPMAYKLSRRIDMTRLDATARYDLHARLNEMPAHNKVCHGDFNPSNIVITDDGTPYILDWSHATQGNASADAARTYLLFKLSGNDQTAWKYFNLFCQKSDTAKQYVQKWLPVIAASQLVKGKASEREFLMRWINVVEYN